VTLTGSARGNPVNRASISLLIDDPAPDFATLARSFGWHAQGPISDRDQVGPAVAEAAKVAAKVVAERGQPALSTSSARPRWDEGSRTAYALWSSTSPRPSQEARSSSSARTASVIARVNWTSS
jgi:hypothetical protein